MAIAVTCGQKDGTKMLGIFFLVKFPCDTKIQEVL